MAETVRSSTCDLAGIVKLAKAHRIKYQAFTYLFVIAKNSLLKKK
jgi:hypothetical protein